MSAQSTALLAGLSRRQGRSKPAAFTLIEVLVVVAIIALLVSILLPSLHRARRQSRVVVCSSNLGQLSRGMMTYAVDSRGRYAPHVANYPNQVQFQRDMRPFPDYRRLLLDRFAGRQPNVLWCPVMSTSFYMQPSRSQQNLGDPEDDGKWSKVYFVAFSTPSGLSYGGQPSYMAGYSIFAGLRANPTPKAGEPQTYSQNFSWTYSGNRSKDREPIDTGNPRDVIIADTNESWPTAGYGTPLRPFRTYHAGNPEGSPGKADTVNRFVDTNIGLGDGSVQTRKQIRNYVGRDGTGSAATGCYSY